MRAYFYLIKACCYPIRTILQRLPKNVWLWLSAPYLVKCEVLRLESFLFMFTFLALVLSFFMLKSAKGLLLSSLLYLYRSVDLYVAYYSGALKLLCIETLLTIWLHDFLFSVLPSSHEPLAEMHFVPSVVWQPHLVYISSMDGSSAEMLIGWLSTGSVTPSQKLFSSPPL